ncbi:MAG: NAD(P)-dependent alcohol dehydrogenase, partial [Alphaproteobacteria bacterium]|nr:NAD(P)-dependent alcohol dehydrogenase [Alphaproteobacteria bacterium]
AASLNYRDLKILKRIYARPPKLPIILLSDGAGEVVAVGGAVKRCKPGDRVMPIYMEGWSTGPMTAARDGWLSRGGDIDGTAVQCAAYREDRVLPIPDFLSYEEAACLPCAAVTAWHALVSVGQVTAGDTVLVMGSGGVSLFALQFAKLHGARVIATSGDDAKLARLIALGASHGINYLKVPDWAERILASTTERGVDHVIEVGGNSTIKQSIRATRSGGHVAIIGDLSGGFGSRELAERGIRMTSIVVGSRQMTLEVLRAIEQHSEKPVIDSRFPFADLKAALQHLESGKHFGKIVIDF